MIVCSSQAARARHPHGAGAVAAQAGKLLPVLAAVRGAEQRRVLHARVNRLRIGERGLDMPHALELPGMLRAVVPLVRGQRLACLGRRVVHKPVGQRLGRARRRNRFVRQVRADARSCRRRRSAGSTARTTRSSARRKSAWGLPASLSCGRSPSRRRTARRPSNPCACRLRSTGTRLCASPQELAHCSFQPPARTLFLEFTAAIGV